MTVVAAMLPVSPTWPSGRVTRARIRWLAVQRREDPGGTDLGGDHMDDAQGRERLLTPGEVATMFRVDPKTVTRWAAAGRISSIRTPGGHRRFRESEVRALLEGGRTTATTATATTPAATASTTAQIPTQHAAPRTSSVR